MMNTLLPINTRPVTLSQLARDMDRLFELASPMNNRVQPAWPGINAWQEGDAYIAEAEIPGFGLEDIQVDVTEDTLTIRGQREQATPEGANTIRRERSITQFERSIRLPAPIEHDQVEATLVNGILQVRMPIAETARPRRICVRQGSLPSTHTKPTNALPSNSSSEANNN